MTFRDLPVALIDRNTDQPRKNFDESALDELASSIREIGLLEPVIVRPAGNRFLLIAGERRWRASQRVPLDVVPARIIEGLDDVQAFVMSVSENVNREDMTLMEEARAFDKLTALGKTPGEIARLFGKSEPYITWRMGLVGLIDQVADLVDRKAMTPTAGYYAAKLSTAGQQVFSARYVRGEFKTEADAVAAARAYLLAEQQTEMWADQTWEPERRRAAAARTRSSYDGRLVSVEQARGALFQLAGANPQEIALAYGDEAAAVRRSIEQLATAAQSALQVIRSAVALHEIGRERTA